ncbi:MAG: carboxypeptidase-like regulatory domain-containing protein [Flavobacteriales bacterium]|nr:carboxypeptidase-like regulatory domain-containing protein [Flavobacteriales bacterium]
MNDLKKYPMAISLLVGLCFSLLASGHYAAQDSWVPPLERKVVVDFTNAKAVDVLANIEQLAGCRFSFNAHLISESQLVTVKAVQRTVREVLDKMFKGKIQYKSKNEYIILTKAPEQPKVISGYVENAKGEKVAGASVYDNTTMASATTNEYGYYEMKIRRETPVQLQVSKSAYADTVVALQPATATLQNIMIEEEKDTTLQHALHTVRDSVLSVWSDVSAWTVEQFTRNPNVENIRDTLYREFQFSLVPFVGTNGRLSGNVTNGWSVNLIGGYNRGVRYGEFGGVFNVNREDVKYFQFAGMTNIVGGNFEGVQLSGFSNINMKRTTGIQFAGFNNLNFGETEGIQFGGFANTNLNKTSGVQFAGMANVNLGEFEGVQFGGFANVNRKKTEAVSFAGFANCALNTMKGVQIAGAFNLALRDFQGVQISGLVNVAGRVKGSQIGVFNFADSLTGVPVGLLSFVNKGYHKIEFSYDELGYAGLAFRTGVRQFYNIIGAGVWQQSMNDSVQWCFGYGIGTAPKLGKKLSLNVDLVSKQFVLANVDRLNLLNRLAVGVDFHVSKRFSLFAGVHVNGRIYDHDADPIPGQDAVHEFYQDRLDSSYSMDAWLGWTAGIRLF